MKKKAHAKKTERKTFVVKLLQMFVVYYLAGLVIGFVGLQLRCLDTRYDCWTLGQYLSDPWLPDNTLIWPLLLLDHIMKASAVLNAILK